MSESSEPRRETICERFEGALLEAPRTAGGEEPLDAELREHAVLCPRCASLLAEVREMQLLLGELASVDATEELPRDREAGLVAEFRSHRNHANRWTNWQVAAVAAAAVVLIALGIAAHRFFPYRGTQNANVAKITAPGPSPSSEANAAAKDEPAPSADAVSFIALPYGEDGSSAEDGAIVRVLMPRATLASLGIPVADITEERVPAEVVLGEDGTPQAIRLVADDREEQF